MSLCVCIPTYKRAHLLALLISNLRQQTCTLDHLIIIDGDPESGAVPEMLTHTINDNVRVIYIPSNHSNLAYQRYLGWRMAANLDSKVLVYFDDDLRIFDPNVLDRLTAPLEKDSVVGVGCLIRFGEYSDGSDAGYIRLKNKPSILANLFGSGREIAPGDLTRTGHRKRLIDNKDKEYYEVHWLNGGVMAYSMSAISQNTFSDDLFALDHIRCGLGEDTFLSRRVGARGKLLYTFRAVVDHPNADSPKAYPHEAYRYAYAATYSRRFLNDYYRVYTPPTFSDRWALVKSYVGNTFLVWMRVFLKPNKLNFALARGTTLGAIYGLTRSPTARNLTPHIDWWKDAEEALIQAQEIS